MFCIFISFIFSKYPAWKILKLCLYKCMFVLFFNQVLKYQLNFKLFRVIYLFAYFGKLWIFSSLFVILYLFELTFLFSIYSFYCYYMLLEQF
jgi:hypothetical protein